MKYAYAGRRSGLNSRVFWGRATAVDRLTSHSRHPGERDERKRFLVWEGIGVSAERSCPLFLCNENPSGRSLISECSSEGIE
jgi:hypothetical protein